MIDDSLLQTVLIVADDPETAAVWGQLFVERGYNAVTENASQAVSAARTLNPPLVVADVKLPHADRMALCRALKFVSRAALLIVTPPHSQEIVELYGAGADECLVQPINPALALVKAMAWIVRQQIPSVNRPLLGAFL